MTDNEKINGWVLYDGRCRWLKEMRLLLPDGKVFGGADAVLEISRRYWWAWPVHALGRVPVLKVMLRAGYEWLARRRNCAADGCEIVSGQPNTTKPERRRVIGLIPLLILPALALCVGDRLAAWGFMWAVALALYAGCKWLTFWEARRRGVVSSTVRATGYLLAWPGMNAPMFLGLAERIAKPHLAEWLFSVGNVLLGITLVWVIARWTWIVNPLLPGWLGMIGLVFLLHFGLFQLLSLLWRRAGVNAPPIMCGPLLASSLSEFWGRRWNTAFHELAHRFIFRPIRWATGPTFATLLAFLLSGLVHDLVISLPARGGYGLPTGYFLVQGLGVVAEHTRFGRRLGLGAGLRGWLFTVVVVACPVFWLFHPPFVERVILPMLQAIGAT